MVANGKKVVPVAPPPVAFSGIKSKQGPKSASVKPTPAIAEENRSCANDCLFQFRYQDLAQSKGRVIVQ